MAGGERAHIPALREAGLPGFLNTILLLHAIGRRRSAGGWEEAAQMGKKSVRTLDRQARQLFGCGLRDLEHRDVADLMAQARTSLLPPPVT